MITPFSDCNCPYLDVRTCGIGDLQRFNVVGWINLPVHF